MESKQAEAFNKWIEFFTEDIVNKVKPKTLTLELNNNKNPDNGSDVTIVHEGKIFMAEPQTINISGKTGYVESKFTVIPPEGYAVKILTNTELLKHVIVVGELFYTEESSIKINYINVDGKDKTIEEFDVVLIPITIPE